MDPFNITHEYHKYFLQHHPAPNLEKFPELYFTFVLMKHNWPIF